MMRTVPFGLSATEQCTPGQHKTISATNTTGRVLKPVAFVVPAELARCYDLSSLTIDGKEQLTSTVVPCSLFASPGGAERYNVTGLDEIAPGAQVQIVVMNRGIDPTALYFQAALFVQTDFAVAPVSTSAPAPAATPTPSAPVAPMAPQNSAPAS